VPHKFTLRSQHHAGKGACMESETQSSFRWSLARANYFKHTLNRQNSASESIDSLNSAQQARFHYNRSQSHHSTHTPVRLRSKPNPRSGHRTSPFGHTQNNGREDTCLDNKEDESTFFHFGDREREEKRKNRKHDFNAHLPLHIVCISISRTKPLYPPSNTERNRILYKPADRLRPTTALRVYRALWPLVAHASRNLGGKNILFFR
jgi:hypothetical protein